MTTPSTRRTGFAVPAVLLCLLALTAIVHGTFILSRFQRGAADSAVDVLQARLVAEAAMREAAARLESPALAKLRSGEVGSLGLTVEASSSDGPLEASPVTGEAGSKTIESVRSSEGPLVVGRVAVRRIRPEWLWMEALGVVQRTGPPVRDRQASVYWSLEPAVRVASVRAVLEVGGEVTVAPGGQLETDTDSISPPGWPTEMCEGVEELFTEAGGDLPTWISTPSLSATAAAGVPPLGLLDGRLLSIFASGDGATDATGAGREVEAAFELAVRTGPLIVSDESIQGVLVVEGNVTLTDDARVIGVLLVGGDVLVRDGGRFDGVARVSGSVTVAEGGRVRGSPCAALRSLENLPQLQTPLPISAETSILLH